MVQIYKDYYEDLDTASFTRLIDDFAAWSEGAGEKPRPGSAKGRFASEPIGELTSLTHIGGEEPANASVALATGREAEPRRISGGARGEAARSLSAAAVADEVSILTRPRGLQPGEQPAPPEDRPEPTARPAEGGDDLKRISGVGPQLEALLQELGFYTFAQIAAWTPANIAWVDQHLEFRGRIERDDWVGQARVLLEEKTNGSQ